MVSKNKKIVETQLNRSLRSKVDVVSSCHFNLPAVIKVPSNLDDGTPFPTSYWLTCPMYNKKVGSLAQLKGQKAYVMPKERSIDIDDIFDFKFAEVLVSERD